MSARVSVEEMAAAVELAADKCEAEWMDDVSTIRAAARALRLIQTGIDPNECDDGTYGEGWHLGWLMALAELRKRALAQGGGGGV